MSPVGAAVALWLGAGAAAPLLPAQPGAFAPSRTEVSIRGDADLTDVETCATCHPDVAAQWRESAHAFASFNNPVYRVSVDRFRSEVGKAPSRFCGGCHDVSLLIDGAMGAEIRADDLRAHAGVTCRTCHGITSAVPDGNGSYQLDLSPIPLPAKGDPESLSRHRARVAPPALRNAALCGSCHRAFLGPDTGNPSRLEGMDDYTAWAQSAYAGSQAERIDAQVAPADCRSCHMPGEAAPRDVSAHHGTVASHRFLGGHTWLYAMERDPALVERGRAFLANRLTLALVPVKGGDALGFDVVVRNAGVGHRFPGGTLDAQDSWLEVALLDAGGRTVARSSGEDVHRFRSLALDERGQPVLERQTHRFRAVAFNQTLGPRDATVVSYRLDSPERLSGFRPPFRAEARLLHRSRNLALQDAACAESKSPRGQAFARATESWGGVPLDPCAPQPVTELARAEATWEALPSPGQLEDYGLGLSHVVQERLDEARRPLLAALAQGPSGSATCTLAQVAAKQGRLEEALAWADTGEAATGLGAAALMRVRGEALSNVWRWREAVAPLARAATLAPSDPNSWRELALAQASAGDERDALGSAQRGLCLQPRDPDLLRIQALALASLGSPEGEVSRALEAYLANRTPDEAPALKAACSAAVPGCALERLPVHVHWLRP